MTIGSAAPPSVVVGVITRMLREAFEGAPGPWAYFTDPSPGRGLLGTVGRLSAGEASTPGGPSGSTIAGHVHHISANLASAAAELRGENATRDRTQSWTVTVVDEREWNAVRSRLRSNYEILMREVQGRPSWDEDSLGVAFGAIAHTAYHLGAIRQRPLTG